MLEYLVNYKGALEINNQLYQSVQLAQSALADYTGTLTIRLNLKAIQPVVQSDSSTAASDEPSVNGTIYKIKVRQYMTKKATLDFDFQSKWNNDNPMPMRIMVGTIIKETKGMYRMSLHADMLVEQTDTCMKCGRALTNPVSRYFGIGPECGGHNYVNPFNTDEELKAAVAAHKEKLHEIKWTGWIIKSAIEEMEEIKC